MISLAYLLSFDFFPSLSFHLLLLNTLLLLLKGHALSGSSQLVSLSTILLLLRALIGPNIDMLIELWEDLFELMSSDGLALNALLLADKVNLTSGDVSSLAFCIIDDLYLLTIRDVLAWQDSVFEDVAVLEKNKLLRHHLEAKLFRVFLAKSVDNGSDLSFSVSDTSLLNKSSCNELIFGLEDIQGESGGLVTLVLLENGSFHGCEFQLKLSFQELPEVLFSLPLLLEFLVLAIRDSLYSMCIGLVVSILNHHSENVLERIGGFFQEWKV